MNCLPTVQFCAHVTKEKFFLEACVGVQVIILKHQLQNSYPAAADFCLADEPAANCVPILPA